MEVFPSGTFACEGKSVDWRLMDYFMAILTNTRGVISLSCEEAVISLDYDLEESWKSPFDRPHVRMERPEPDTLQIFINRKGVWVLTAELRKSN